jgi:hypothetical protein
MTSCFFEILQTVRVWDEECICQHTLPTNTAGVWALTVFKPSAEAEDRLVSGSLDYAVKVWGP